jgi:hypothetical protein
MSKAKGRKEEIYQPPPPPRWKGTESLELVYALNERCLRLLRDLAASDPGGWPLIIQHRELWSTLTEEAVKRAARLSFVILDVHFTDEAWWPRVVQLTDLPVGAGSAWPAKIAEPLMSEVLVFAWHTAKWDRRAARLSLRARPAVVDAIAALTPQQLTGVIAHHGELRLRRQDNPDFWGDLLLAAHSGDENALEAVHLRAKLLLSGELTAPGE